ncbi:MAG: 2-acyl-glycerophospho-ethanolamine acyltransferase [Promethearchaeota archaeon]|nr:MAG: 2-acyl-glycerophospho-ethanolamine acyltransferase [Candidatus Lokiarchaeota archaeon]
MAAKNVTIGEEKEAPKLNKKQLFKDAFYVGVKGIGELGLKLFSDLMIEGEENVPVLGKGIITTISDNPMRDMLLISQLTGRKVHFMLDPKLIRHKVYGPVLKNLGMFRSTENKEDKEPIEKVFHLLNEKRDLVAMTPETKYEYETQVKAMAAIIKFAIAADAPIIPVGISTQKAKIFDLIPTKGFYLKVGSPLEIEKKLNRDKYRSQRYELAEDIIKIVDSLKIKKDES